MTFNRHAILSMDRWIHRSPAMFCNRFRLQLVVSALSLQRVAYQWMELKIINHHNVWIEFVYLNSIETHRSFERYPCKRRLVWIQYTYWWFERVLIGSVKILEHLHFRSAISLCHDSYLHAKHFLHSHVINSPCHDRMALYLLRIFGSRFIANDKMFMKNVFECIEVEITNFKA